MKEELLISEVFSEVLFQITSFKENSELFKRLIIFFPMSLISFVLLSLLFYI